jgi:hypothetical protein
MLFALSWIPRNLMGPDLSVHNQSQLCLGAEEVCPPSEWAPEMAYRDFSEVYPKSPVREWKKVEKSIDKE